MEIIEQSVNQVLLPYHKKIEYAGRICYKSENKISDNSYKDFIRRLIFRGHESVLEHGTIIISVSLLKWLKTLLINPKYLRLSKDNSRYIISGNMRSFRDFAKKHTYFAEICSYLSNTYEIVFDEFKKHKKSKVKILNTNQVTRPEHKYYTFHFTIDRAVSHRIVRHRELSFSQESTRYCNYKTGLTFINFEGISFNQLMNIETIYNYQIKQGFNPEMAAKMLPACLKTEIIVTGNLKQLEHVIKERTSAGADAQIKELFTEVKELLKPIILKLFI